MSLVKSHLVDTSFWGSPEWKPSKRRATVSTSASSNDWFQITYPKPSTFPSPAPPSLVWCTGAASHSEAEADHQMGKASKRPQVGQQSLSMFPGKAPCQKWAAKEDLTGIATPPVKHRKLCTAMSQTWSGCYNPTVTWSRNFLESKNIRSLLVDKAVEPCAGLTTDIDAPHWQRMAITLWPSPTQKTLERLSVVSWRASAIFRPLNLAILTGSKVTKLLVGTPTALSFPWKSSTCCSVSRTSSTNLKLSQSCIQTRPVVKEDGIMTTLVTSLCSASSCWDNEIVVCHGEIWTDQLRTAWDQSSSWASSRNPSTGDGIGKSRSNALRAASEILFHNRDKQRPLWKDLLWESLEKGQDPWCHG